MQDVLLTIRDPTGANQRIAVCPDVLMQDLRRHICSSWNLDSDIFKMWVYIPGSDGKEVEQPLTIDTSETSVGSLVYRHLLLKCHGDIHEDFEIPFNEEGFLMRRNPAEVEYQYSDVQAVQYEEFDVVKVNKFGHRQERRLGIDGDKMYNMLPHRTTGFFVQKAKTKHPTRSISDIVNVYVVPDVVPPSFMIEIRGTKEVESLFFQVKEIVCAKKIIAKLEFLLKRRRDRAPLETWAKTSFYERRLEKRRTSYLQRSSSEITRSHRKSSGR
jgi:hypothetical protein